MACMLAFPCNINQAGSQGITTESSVYAAAINKNMLLMEGRSSGQFIYYLDGSVLKRTKDGRTSKKLAENVRDEFYLSGNYMYYVDRNGVINRRRKDGTKPARLKKYVSRIVEVKGGYIYYINTSGETYRIGTNGKSKAKLLSPSASYHTQYTKDYIYYTAYTKGDDGYTDGYQVKRIQRDGTGMKTVLTLPRKKDIEEQFSFAASKNYVYFSDGISVCRIDANGKTENLYTAETAQKLQIIQASDQMVSLTDEIEEGKHRILQLTGDGTLAPVSDLSDYQIYEMESFQLESAGTYQILTCYGCETPNHYVILNQSFEVVQEVPNVVKGAAEYKCKKIKIVGNTITVKYQKGRNVQYKNYKIVE